MRSFLAVPAALVAFALACNAAPAAANVTYQGSDTEGSVSVTYVITTDGTLGLLTLANIVSSKATFTGNAPSGLLSFGPLTGVNNLYFVNTNPGGSSPVSATASSLFFNFAGGGGLNLSLGNFDVIYTGSNNPTDLGTSATPGLEGLLFALAGAQSTDDDSVVFHDPGQLGGVNPLPDKEIDLVGNPDFYLHAGTYTSVAAANLAFASAVETVPEPASLPLVVVGVAGMGLASRKLRKDASEASR